MNIWKDRNFKPMLLNTLDKPFNSHDYIYEMKFDGIRAICFVDKNNVYIMSRNNVDMTNLYPELSNLNQSINKKVVFDGEIVLMDNGKPSFLKLQERMRLKNKKRIDIASIDNPVTFVAFDILYEDKNLTNLTLMERKKILSKYKDTDIFVKTKYIEYDGIKLFNSIKKRNLEGIVAKLKSGTYHINKRTSDFVKIKNILRDEFIIGGYIVKKDNISLLLGEYKGNKLYFIGKCSLSKSNKDIKKITESKAINNPFYNFSDEANFIKPIYCYIEYTEKTKNNSLRHPVFRGLM